MGRIARELADVVIVTSDNPRSEDPLAIIDAILAGMGGEPAVEPDRPIFHGHTLLIPRAHHETLTDLPDDDPVPGTNFG